MGDEKEEDDLINVNQREDEKEEHVYTMEMNGEDKEDYILPGVDKRINSRMKLTRAQLCLIVQNLLILIVLVGIFAFMASDIALKVSEENRSGNVDSELESTAEFQMVLYPSVWKNRDKALNDFFSYFQSISGFPFLSKPIIENQRTQYYIHINDCKPYVDAGLRLRNYIWGPDQGNSTLDSKVESCHYDDCIVAPLQPSDKYSKDAFQKVEHDVHPCSSKYSRETRVDGIPFKPNFLFCKDVYEFYPYLWDTKHNNERLGFTALEYWYTGVYEGVFSNGAKFKSDVTIQYNSLEEMQKGNILDTVTGEYSLRIWSTHNGYGPWNQTTFDEVSGWHQQLCKKFGSYGDYPCPK